MKEGTRGGEGKRGEERRRKEGKRRGDLCLSRFAVEYEVKLINFSAVTEDAFHLK
jgi:hypothetical protein